jgi:hypothetical protein
MLLAIMMVMTLEVKVVPATHKIKIFINASIVTAGSERFDGLWRFHRITALTLLRERAAATVLMREVIFLGPRSVVESGRAKAPILSPTHAV